MAKTKTIGIHKGTFSIENTPSEAHQQVAIIFKDYKIVGVDKKYKMFKSQFDKLMSCEPAAGFEMKCMGGVCTSGKKSYPEVPCVAPKCSVIASGNYTVGGTTDSNPVYLEFSGGETMKFSQAGMKVSIETCSPDEVQKFKV